MSKPDDQFEPESSSVIPDNRDTFTPPVEESGPPRIARVGLALAAVREAVEAGCGDVQVYGGTITGENAAKRMDAAISAVRQLAMLQGYAVFQADSWSQGPESAGGAVVVAKCGG